ncbi:hypothetical protein F2P56_010644 [Juglans regia]|uniref:PGG domain-containing protein n=2 Tax=Juglans regia TaxID=51240 RepID=A0A833XKE4_JUGRE|nr:uncharacterized protein LOC109008585 isoform X2 [Juglans regia]XP_035546109.1 uncharacterized protein LOC118348475 isoform X2 [Juglans regia]KAF5441852.1 hypothetical protein F2P56_037208 [Juglans regia]KAF5470102.1 hypothetical protein F2P56_010644 [Juglans regia]
MAERRDDEELRGKFTKLYNAVRDGNLDETEVILESLSPGALNWKIQDKDQTALHTAVTHGHVHIVEALVMQMSNEGLAMYDSDGHTALTLAVVLGKWGMVECMLRQYFDLISIRHSEGKNLPVVMAIDFRHIEMARQLYYLTPDKDLIPQDNNQEIQDRNGATLFTRAIYTGTLDIALGLILTCPRLALALDKDDESPILALASIRHSFPSGIQLGFCKQRIYSCMRIPFAPSISDTRLNVSNGEQRQSNQEDQNIISGITQLYEMKKIHDQYNELLSHMCKVISESKTQQLKDGRVYSAITRATKNGSFEFVSKMLETDLRFIRYRDGDRRNIFMLAVLHRQEKIFSILYSRDTMMSYNAMKCLQDAKGNNILHMAGMLEHSTRVNQIPGAALQMQRELQWFKEVERIVHPKDKETTNKDGLTPRQLFTEKHENMMEKGEKWMKDTARSCTVVGALIVTIMFAVAFTIPGVLMFLGILTSRYTEDDFLEYLPRQMIIGLSTLFCSIATMMITFASALLIILHEQSRIAIPLICLGGVPVTIFLWIQLPILKDMIISTYGPSIFDRKMKLKL